MIDDEMEPRGRLRTHIINVLWIFCLVFLPVYFFWHGRWLLAICSFGLGWFVAPVLSFAFDRARDDEWLDELERRQTTRNEDDEGRMK
jgi:hypothetical protein